MQFKYIAALIASLAVNGALAIPVPDAEAMDAVAQDALQARAEQIEQANQWIDDDIFDDWHKVKRAEQAKQGEQFFVPNNVGFNAGFNFNWQNRFFLQRQQPWWLRQRLLLNNYNQCWRGWC